MKIMTKNGIYFKGSWKEILQEVIRVSEPVIIDEDTEVPEKDDLLIINPDNGKKGIINVGSLDHGQWKEISIKEIENWVHY